MKSEKNYPKLSEREEAMKWWNDMSDAERIMVIPADGRFPESYTGREIEELLKKTNERIKQLEDEKCTTQKRIDNTTDNFFIYGMVKRIEEIDKELSSLSKTTKQNDEI